MTDHDDLDNSGRVPHIELDDLATELRKRPITVTGARDDGTALASLLTALEKLGLIVDSTTAT